MPRDRRMYLHDIRESIGVIRGATDGKSKDEYLSDSIARAAVERSFEIVGEAPRQMREVDPDVEGRISHFQRIIDFRNFLAHGYHRVNHELVWDITESDVPVLEQEVAALLQSPAPPDH